MRQDVVTRFCEAIEAGVGIPSELFTSDVTFDATVPDWRFTKNGPDDTSVQLSQWFDHPGHFEQLERTALPEGELVEFALAWDIDGVRWACHQVHIVRTRAGRITSDTAWCGGRWSAQRLAEMGAAEVAAR